MKITRVYVAKSNSGVSVGYGSVVFEDALIVRFSIMKSGKDGKLFVNWPSKKGADNKWYPDVSFVVDEAAENKYAIKNSVDSEIIKEFNKVVGVASTKEQTPAADASFNYGDNQNDGSGPAPETPADPPKKKAVIKWK